MPIYRTNGAWGAGIGVNLTPAQVDGNFYELRTDLDDVIANPPTANSIETIVANGFTWTVTLTDGTVLDPLAVPVVYTVWRGEWAPFTLYSAADLFRVEGEGIFAVLQNHTSAATFDPNAAGGSPLAPFYNQLIGVGSNTLLDGLADVTVTSVADNDFIAWAAGSSAWTNRTTAQVAALIGPLIGLDDLDDVDAPAPSLGQVLTWIGSPASWQAQDPAGVASLDDLGDVTLGFPTAGQVLTYNGLVWENANTALDDLSDVSVPTPNDGDVLTYESTSPAGWVASPPAAVPTTLDALSDVAVPTPADGDFLQYESGSPAGWRNQAGTSVSSLGDATLPVNAASLLSISEALGSPPTFDTKKITIADMLAAGNITLGSTAVALGSTVTTIASLTLSGPALTGNVTINKNAAALPSSPTGILKIGEADGSGSRVHIYSFAGISTLEFRRAQGTNASPSAVGTNTSLGSISYFGYGATAYSTARVQINATTEQAWTDTAQGTRFTVSVTPNGTTTLTEALRISENLAALFSGEVGLAAGKALAFKTGTGARAGDATLVAGTVTVTNTTVTANTKVLLSRKTIGGTVGNLSYTLSAGASFTINSNSATDTSVITYMLVELN